MDSLRTLKKRKPKKHARVAGERPKSRGIRIKRRGPTLNLAFCFALFLGLAVVTQGQAEEYYNYETPNGELVISNRQPPPGSKIIKQQNMPEANDSRLLQSQQRNNPEPNGCLTKQHSQLAAAWIFTAGITARRRG
jgi:hypothetical protein